MTMPGWQPMPPPRESHTLRNVVLILSALLVLCCAGAVVGGVFLFRGVAREGAPVRAAADTFITDLQEENLPHAYGLLCDGTRDRFSAGDFADGVNGQPKISGHEIDNVRVMNQNGHLVATVTANLTLDTGFVDHHAFPLIKQRGEWKVCGQPY